MQAYLTLTWKSTFPFVVRDQLLSYIVPFLVMCRKNPLSSTIKLDPKKLQTEEFTVLILSILYFLIAMFL